MSTLFARQPRLQRCNGGIDLDALVGIVGSRGRQVPELKRCRVVAGADEQSAHRVVAACRLACHSHRVSADPRNLVDGRIREIRKLIAIKIEARRAPVRRRDVHDIESAFSRIAGTALHVRARQRLAGEPPVNVAVLPHLPPRDRRGRDALDVRARRSADFVAVGAIGIEQVGAGKARLGGRVRFQRSDERAAAIVGRAAPRDEPVGDRQEQVVVVRVGRNRRIVDAVDGDLREQRVGLDLAGQRGPLPHQIARVPAIDVVAGIIRVATTPQDEVAPIAVPTKSAPCHDNLRWRLRAASVEWLQGTGRPDVAVQIRVRVQPGVLRHLHQERQQRAREHVGRRCLGRGNARGDKDDDRCDPSGEASERIQCHESTSRRHRIATSSTTRDHTVAAAPGP